MTRKYEEKFIASLREQMLGEMKQHKTKFTVFTKNGKVYELVDDKEEAKSLAMQIGGSFKAPMYYNESKVVEKVEIEEAAGHYDMLRGMLSTMDKDDPLYAEISKIVDGVKTVASSTVKPNKVKTKQADEPTQLKPVANNGNPLEVGDVLNDYFSYTMTFNNFYQVVSVKGKSITARPIRSDKDGDGWYGQETPIKNAFSSNETTVFKMRGNFAKKEDVSLKSGRSGRIYYVAPKSDGTYPSSYYNRLD